jgi:DNA-directed RNA polymerase specialized sigma24 family protein
MTAALPFPPSLDVVRAALADDEVRARIESIVRRRVPTQEVGDVVHQVASEALSATDPPVEPEAVLRWFFGITRHKVADHHRAARRRGEGVDAENVPARPAPLEARSLLLGILADATRDPRAAETMEWIARESEGERLDEMAREARLPAATVRQRVSRLRRWLRKRWVHEALLLAAASVVALAVALGRGHTRDPIPIYPDPTGDPAAAASIVLQGRWHVARVSPDEGISQGLRALVDADAMTTAVDVDGDRLRLASAVHHGEARLEVGPVVSGRFEVRVTDAHGHVQRATVSVDAEGRLVVVGTEGGDWRGTVVLER